MKVIWSGIRQGTAVAVLLAMAVSSALGQPAAPRIGDLGSVIVTNPTSEAMREQIKRLQSLHKVKALTDVPAVDAQIWSLPPENVQLLLDDVRKAAAENLLQPRLPIHRIDGDIQNLLTSSPSALLNPSQQAQLAKITSSKSALKTSVTRIRRDDLTPRLLAYGMGPDAGFPKSGSFKLNLLPDLDITAVKRSLQKTGAGPEVWIGEVQRPKKGKPNEREFGMASITIKGTDISGVVSIGADVYSLHPLGDGEIAVTLRDRDSASDHPAEAMLAPTPTTEAEIDEGAFDAEPAPIRLFVLYTKRVKDRSPSIEADITNMIALTNASFGNSGVEPVSVELAKIQDTTMVETENVVADTKRLMARVNDPADILSKLRRASKANVVALIADYEYPALPCGWSPMIKADVEHAVAAVSYDCLFTNFSLTHELGHLFGARHDRGNDSASQPFPYGHGFVRVDHWRTIMAYPTNCLPKMCPRILYWANPKIMHPTENVPLGTAENEFDARVIGEQARRVARLRTW